MIGRATHGPGPHGPRAGRRGFFYLDVQVAFATLGVVLAGLAPVVVAQVRLMNRFEARFDRGYPAGAGATIHYLVPPADPWARKLGAGAAFQETDPGPSSPPSSSPPANTVQVVSVTGAGPGDAMGAVVTVTALSPPGALTP